MPPKHRSFWRELQRLFFVYIWHQLTSSSFSAGKLVEGILRLILALIPFSVIIFSGRSYKWYLLGGWVVIALIIRRKDLLPRNQEFVQEGYVERKGMFTLALMELEKSGAGKRLTEKQRGDIQHLALDMIVSYARGHRSDTRSVKIFASLLIEEQDEMIVIARDQNSSIKRTGPSRYKTSAMLAGRALREHRVQVSGDIGGDFPDTPGNKPYKSILAIPILDVATSRAKGVVSIDSSDPYHFDGHENDLETKLMPYVRLLALTLA